MLSSVDFIPLFARTAAIGPPPSKNETGDKACDRPDGAQHECAGRRRLDRPVVRVGRKQANQEIACNRGQQIAGGSTEEANAESPHR